MACKLTDGCSLEQCSATYWVVSSDGYPQKLKSIKLHWSFEGSAKNSSIPFHHITSHYTEYIALHYLYIIHCITLHNIAIHCIALLHYIALHYITWHYITFRYIAPQYLTNVITIATRICLVTKVFSRLFTDPLTRLLSSDVVSGVPCSGRGLDSSHIHYVTWVIATLEASCSRRSFLGI